MNRELGKENMLEHSPDVDCPNLMGVLISKARGIH